MKEVEWWRDEKMQMVAKQNNYKWIVEEVA